MDFPNEWASAPKEQVADWLDHPCTGILRKELAAGIADCDQQILAAAESFTNRSIQPDAMARAVDTNGSLKSGYWRTLELLGRAEEYVKAE